MKQTFLLLLTLILLSSIGCGSRSSDNNTTAANTPAVAKTPADGFYQGKGIVTKINNELGSVEIDHENIPDLMPAMKMEFPVKDKGMLKPIAVGDAVTFTIEHKQSTEIIIAIGK
jgi:Cu/Ag efflux protein CusF